MINKLILGLIVAVFISCTPLKAAYAQQVPTQQQISYWGNLSEKEKEEYRQLYQENKNSPRWQEYVKRYRWFKSMSPDAQKNIRDNWEQYKHLAPAQRQQFLENLKEIKHMTPVQWHSFQKKLAYWHSLTPAQRESLRKKLSKSPAAHK